jgi:hypothetical protein
LFGSKNVVVINGMKVCAPTVGASRIHSADEYVDWYVRSFP